jgi:hypothetical protein
VPVTLPWRLRGPGVARDDLVDARELRDRELGRAELGRQRGVLELRARPFHAVGQDSLMVEHQGIAVEDVPGGHPAGVGGVGSGLRRLLLCQEIVAG